MKRDIEPKGIEFQQRHLADIGVTILEPRTWFMRDVRDNRASDNNVTRYLFSPHMIIARETPETYLLLTTSKNAYFNEHSEDTFDKYVSNLILGNSFEHDVKIVGEVTEDDSFTSLTSESVVTPFVIDPKSDVQDIWRLHRVAVNMQTGTRHTMEFSTPANKRNEYEAIGRKMIDGAILHNTI